MESIRVSCEGSDHEDSSKLHERPLENRRSYEQQQQEHTSRSPSPCLSTSTSISSCEIQQQSKMITNGIGLSLPNSYGSLYCSHPSTSASSNYSSLPFPIASLSSSFQLPMSMPLPIVASSIMTSNKNSPSFPTPYTTQNVATTSGGIMTSSSNSITTVSTMGIPSRSLENNGVSSKNAIPGLVCLVCGDSSSGKHYGILACNGCSGFFKRSVRRRLIYRCQAGQGHCVIDKAHRNQCQACRLKKCLQMGMNKDAVQNERQPRNSATLRPEVLAEMDHERIIREAAAAVGAFGPPVSLAMGLASAAAHAHYVNGMVRNNEHPAAALHAAAAIAAATATTQRAEIERDIADRDRDISSSEEDRSPVADSPLPPPTKMMRSDSNGYQLVVSSTFRQSPHPQTPLRSPCTSVPQTGMLQPPPLTPVVSVGAMPTLSSVSTGGWMYSSDTQPQAHTTGFLPFQMQDNVYETAARLLFMSIKWAKSLPSFLGLPFRDQIILLEESWNELFLICAIQFCLPMDNCSLFSPAQFGQHLSSSTAAERGNANSKNTQQMSTDLRFLSELVTRFRAVAVDPAEFACLKAIILFKSETRGLKDPIQVENLQDQAQVMLNQHIRNQQPQRPARFGRLLLILPLLRQVSSFRLEHLYFRHTIGDTPMEKVLHDMYKN